MSAYQRVRDEKSILSRDGLERLSDGHWAHRPVEMERDSKEGMRPLDIDIPVVPDQTVEDVGHPQVHHLGRGGHEVCLRSEVVGVVNLGSVR